MTESQGKGAKEGADESDVMVEMRERRTRAEEVDRDNRVLGIEDLKFVTIPGHQWDAKQRKARRGRPCYEFPILRSHWRQVVNDQKKARPGIKVRAVEDGDAKGAELRQGIIRNIESVSNAERAYDAAFESLTACGFGAWRVVTEFSQDDGWEQDIRIRPIKDALTSVWLDDENADDPEWGFVEQSISRKRFKALYPKAEAVSFESAATLNYGDWFTQDEIRIAEYWRKVPVTKTLVMLSDGRTVDKEQLTPEALQKFAGEGVSVVRERQVQTTKVVTSIVSGCEEIDGPNDTVFSRIPIVPVWANRHYIEGRWIWAGMVRFSRDPQRLVNYNMTTAVEVLAKQHKSAPVLTPKMLEGKGIKEMWDNSGAVDTPYYVANPDPAQPGGPHYLSAPPLQNAFMQMAQMSTDMIKATDGIFDESQGKATNATSGKAIMARQAQGDTATYDYQDALSMAIQATGEIILSALPKVYDTPRAMRVLGKDGAEEWVKLYEEVQGQDGRTQTINDLSAGKYDVTVTTGPSYDTQRMEFVEVLSQLGQNNPAIAAGIPDLIVASMDFPKAEEAAERLKLLLPPQIQQSLAQGKNGEEVSPQVMQLQGQLRQMQQQAQEHIQGMQQEMRQLQAKAQSKDDAMLRERNTAEGNEIARFKAITERMALGIKVEEAERQFVLDQNVAAHNAMMAEAGHVQGAQEAVAGRQFQAQSQAADHEQAAYSQQADQAAAQAQQEPQE